MTDTLETRPPRPLKAHVWAREKDDWYIEGGVYDPACGTGLIVIGALKAGLKGYGSDLVNRGWDSTRTPHDFLAGPDEQHDNIVINVPFKIARPFAIRALQLARAKVAMVFPLARLNAARWIRKTPLRRVWLLTPRPSMPPGRVILAGGKPGGGKTDFCFLVWERGHEGPPEMDWLLRDGG